LQYIYLAIAIFSEVFATSILKLTNGFSRLWPSMAVVIGYGVSFYSLSLALKTVPVGIAYAVWSGVGTAVVTAIGAILYRQSLTPIMYTGIAFIIMGVIVLNLKGHVH